MPADRLLAPASMLYDANLRFLNTLSVSAVARCLAEVKSVDELQQTLAWWKSQHADLPVLVLGEGSNLVFAGDYPGLVIRVMIRGRDIIDENDEFVWLRVGAGENWHELVEHCVNFHLWGLENLALIPGHVGAAPIQNIGAYGVELNERFSELSAVEIRSGVSVTFDREACCFGYRESVFKQKLKNQYVITSLTLRLSKKPQLILEYPALQAWFDRRGVLPQSPDQIFHAVCDIRRGKLPDPRSMPNAGSFFKNPLVDSANWRRLQRQWPGIVGYPQRQNGADTGAVKLAAGWMIERAGWRGRRSGAVGIHEQQSLVLVNPGHGSGAEILDFARSIQEDIREKFAVDLEIEPSVVP